MSTPRKAFRVMKKILAKPNQKPKKKKNQKSEDS
jgi:hypothetical protein